MRIAGLFERRVLTEVDGCKDVETFCCMDGFVNGARIYTLSRSSDSIRLFRRFEVLHVKIHL